MLTSPSILLSQGTCLDQERQQLIQFFFHQLLSFCLDIEAKERLNILQVGVQRVYLHVKQRIKEIKFSRFI